MATEYLRPNGNGDLQEFTSQFPDSGEAAWEDVDESSPDGDSSYIQTGGGHAVLQKSLFTIPATAIPVGSTINYVYGRSYARAYQGQYSFPINVYYHLLKINGTVYDSSNLPCFTSILKTYANKSSQYYAPACGWSDKWLLNPNTGLTWEIADLAGMQIGIGSYSLLYSGGTYRVDARVSQLFIEIDYNLPPTSYVQAQIIM